MNIRLCFAKMEYQHKIIIEYLVPVKAGMQPSVSAVQNSRFGGWYLNSKKGRNCAVFSEDK
jgi:hypothetical protein